MVAHLVKIANTFTAFPMHISIGSGNSNLNTLKTIPTPVLHPLENVNVIELIYPLARHI